MSGLGRNVLGTAEEIWE